MDLNSKIIIVDDHVLFRQGMKLLIEKEGMGEVIAEAENGLGFLSLLDHQKPDIVLLSFEIAGLDGLEIIKKAISRYPSLRILVFNMQYQWINFTEIIKIGAMGILLKGSGVTELGNAIKTVLRDESYFPFTLLRRFLLNTAKESTNSRYSMCGEIEFSNRELEILQYFCEGLTANQIAEKLYRSVKTIEVHRARLLQKTGAKNTINLVLFAIKNKIAFVG